jgi:hypothetical protein
MKKIRENISLYELSKLKYQKNSLLKDLGVFEKTSSSSTTITNKEKISTTQTLSFEVYIGSILIGDRSRSHTPSFLLTFKIFNKNVHNCLVDSGASLNIISYSVCLQINAKPQKSSIQIVQLD